MIKLTMQPKQDAKEDTIVFSPQVLQSILTQNIHPQTQQSITKVKVITFDRLMKDIVARQKSYNDTQWMSTLDIYKYLQDHLDPSFSCPDLERAKGIHYKGDTIYSIKLIYLFINVMAKLNTLGLIKDDQIDYINKFKYDNNQKAIENREFKSSIVAIYNVIRGK